MADQGGNSLIRDYRKGNWTVSETMVLIEAKRMDDERRMKRSSDSEGRSKPAELRWKWVEDYCWRKGCLRSQNQCNDKWDNLMRDYKKVRDYERRIAENGDENEALSYWKLEKNERKDKNLPSNMLLQVYEALVGVVERKGSQKMVTVTTSAGGSASNPNITYVMERPITSVHPPLPPLLQHQVSVSVPVLHPRLPPPPPPQVQASPSLSYSQPLPAVDSDTSGHSDSPAKRRRRRRGGGGGGGEASSGGSGSTSQEVGSAISKSASIIAEAIQACEERKERRHRDLLSLHERKLKVEESKTEINRQCISGLVDAINNLANSIFALASHKNQSTPK
ncbi:trihelix transcription factor GTL1 isoform X2 [Ricinus communis]|uniref:Transcription factor, putative n=1 Tax=Ricinus communis TaxID=3988 RepID=B9RPY7_RICCO|nr:trihelix transcription factor GTL1 isoform X2 [Ricinus communis]EEF46587.1 transcription factor, putative [Ricinus communis]|eukprot:XP_002515806.1 trihelix transcription factor GTL1 isoform X2 [Ricinus communis]